MTGAMITVTVDDLEVRKLLSDILLRTKNRKPAMGIIGNIVRKSIHRNFEVGGRPPWMPSQRAKKTGDKTLIKTRQLMNSFTIDAYQDRVEVGTNKEYAAAQNFGANINHPARERTMFFKKYKSGEKKGLTRFSKESKASYGRRVAGRAYTIHIPPRPFMMVQDEDWPAMTLKLGQYLIGGTA